MAATVSGILLTGNHASRPTSGVSAGTLYSCTTHSLVYQTTDTGSTWVTWATLGTSSTTMATDTLWDAAGDLAVGTGANTGAKLTVGSTGDILNVAGGTAAWTAPGTLWAPGSGTPALTAATTNPTLGTGGTTAHRYIQMGKLVYVSGNITFGSSGVAQGVGEYHIALPVTSHALGGNAMGSAVLYDSSAGTFNLAVPYFSSTSVMRFAITGTNLVVTEGTPWVWAANDQINYFAMYEAA